MEQKIYETEDNFDLTKLSISQPSAIQGGAYVTKIKYLDNPLYIQTPKCLTKQGLNETNKKAYIDLMYSNENNKVIEWFENLESALVKLIYDKRELWFQNEMELEDIENFFNPITRAYKGGKYHLVRINVPKNKTLNSQYSCNIYDENENIIAIQDLTDKHDIIPCLEVHSIKFSARNFQVDLVGKQIMILNNKPLFSSCMIRRPNSINNYSIDDRIISTDEQKIEGAEKRHRRFFVAVDEQQVCSGDQGQPRHEGGVFNWIPCPESPKTQCFICPSAAHQDSCAQDADSKYAPT